MRNYKGPSNFFMYMSFSFEEQSSDALTHIMPNWSNLQKKVQSSTKWNSNQILNLAINTVKYKIEAANMHYLILKYSYTANGDKNFLKRTMVENIIFNLSSLLDSLAHIINQIYDFKVDFNKVQIDHQKNPKNCVRCKIDDTKEELSKYINLELPKLDPKLDPKITNNWYYDFSNYRNQIMHRTIYCLMLNPGQDYLPDDPTNFTEPKFLKYNNNKPIFDSKTGKPLLENYVKLRELREYSKEIFDKVLGIIEKICSYLIIKI